MTEQTDAAEKRQPGRPKSPSALTEQITVYMTPEQVQEIDMMAYEESIPGSPVSRAEIIRRCCDRERKRRGGR